MSSVEFSCAMAMRRAVDPAKKAWKYIKELNDAAGTDMDAVAIRTGSGDYTYGEMFREWERYASVFTALGMTGEKNARVGLLSSVSAEVIMALYGLNMAGAGVSLVAPHCSFNPMRVFKTIEEEKLTDFIITDDLAPANLIKELFGHKAELGLRNIIILHVPVLGEFINPVMSVGQEAKYLYIKSWCAPISRI